MRGAMNFDDYNYANINKHVLINNNGTEVSQGASPIKHMDSEYGEEDDHDHGSIGHYDKGGEDF